MILSVAIVCILWYIGALYSAEAVAEVDSKQSECDLGASSVCRRAANADDPSSSRSPFSDDVEGYP